MRPALTLFTSLLMLTACDHRSDTAVLKNLPGTWHVDFSSTKGTAGKSTFAIAPNGDFTHQTISPNGIHTNESVGTFQVKDRVLTQTTTKSSYTNWHVPIVRRARIISANSREMVVVFDDTKDKFTIRKDAR